MTPPLRLLTTLLLAGLASAGTASAAKSVTHQGITWTFGEDRPTGTFANGEPWVLGPVTIIKIDPSSATGDATNSGSMIDPNPASGQGFTSNLSVFALRYDATKNVALNLPKTLDGGQTLVSSITQNVEKRYMIRMCALTVVASTPAEGSFRPPVYGKADKRVRWTVKDMQLGFLPSFPVPTSAPTDSEIRTYLPPLPWVELVDSWYGGQMTPYENIAGTKGGDGFPSTYGREIANKWGRVGLWLCLAKADADKRAAAIATIQAGIDIWGFVKAGGGYYPDGGHRCGRKFPVVFAAAALREPELITLAGNPDIFQEDAQTFIVQASDVGRKVDAPKVTYSQEHVGLPEWGIRHRFEPNKDDSSWTNGNPYRHVVWPHMIGPTLAIELMGKRDIWNHPPIFLYNERYVKLSGLGSFFGFMWNNYRKPAAPKNLRIVE